MNLAHCYGNKYTDGTDIYFMVNGVPEKTMVEPEKARFEVSPTSYYMTQEEWRDENTWRQCEK